VVTGTLPFETVDRGGARDSRELPAGTFVEQSPNAAAGLRIGPAAAPAIWLEVTYARGTAWTATPTPIEAPRYLDAG
jgi:hypothetical protein